MLAVDHEFLGRLYATPQAENRWISVLDDLCTRLNVESAVVQSLVGRPGGGLLHVWTGRDTQSLAKADLHDRCLNNPLNPRLDPAPRTDTIEEIGSDLRLFRDDPCKLSRLQQHLSQVGLGHAVWAGFRMPDDRHFALIMHRRAGDTRDLDESEEAFLRDVLPHLKQAVGLACTIAESRNRAASLEAAVEHVQSGLLICDENLNVFWQNKSARRLIERSHHVALSGARLVGADAEARLKLKHLIAGSSRGAAIALGESGRSPLHLRAAHLEVGSRAQFWFPGGIALFVADPEVTPGLELNELVTLFGFTQAEARLAAALADGTSINEYAAQRGITVGTARIQMKQVLAKTDAGRQPEVVRQLYSSVAMSSRKCP